MITAIVAIVLIAGALVYYFVFFKPGIERDAIRLQEQKLEIEIKEKEQKATEEAQRKANLEKCLKEAEEWKAEMLGELEPVIKTSEDLDRALKFVQNEYQNRIDNCNSKYGD